MEKTITIEVTEAELQKLITATQIMRDRNRRPQYNDVCRNVVAPAYGSLCDKLYFTLVHYHQNEEE